MPAAFERLRQWSRALPPVRLQMSFQKLGDPRIRIGCRRRIVFDLVADKCLGRTFPVEGVTSARIDNQLVLVRPVAL